MQDNPGVRIEPIMILAWEDALLDGSGPDPAQVAAAAHRRGVRMVAVDALWARGATGDGLVWLMVLQVALRAKGQKLAVIARRGGPLWRSMACLDSGIHLCACVSQAARLFTPDSDKERDDSSNDSGASSGSSGVSGQGMPPPTPPVRRCFRTLRAGRQSRRRALKRTMSRSDINSSTSSQEE